MAPETETPAAPPAGSVLAPVFTTEVCRDADRFGQLGPDWTSLYRRCRTATPFQSHAWLHSWWLSYGRRGRLRVVLVRRDGDLVAAAPLMLVRRPFPVLVPLGGSISDFSDVLLDDDCPQAADELAGALAALARTAVIDLREVRPGAAVEQVHARWDGPRRELADSSCLELPAVPMDELLGRLASARAQRARAKLRKLDALGIEERVVPGNEIPAAVERLLALHRRQWQGRGVTPEHLSTRFSDHLVRSIRSMVEGGDARGDRVPAGRRGGGRAISRCCRPQLAGGYLYGADPMLRERKVGRGDDAAAARRAAHQHERPGQLEPAARQRAVQAPLAARHRPQPAVPAGPRLSDAPGCSSPARWAAPRRRPWSSGCERAARGGAARGEAAAKGGAVTRDDAPVAAPPARGAVSRRRGSAQVRGPVDVDTDLPPSQYSTHAPRFSGVALRRSCRRQARTGWPAA